MEPNEKHIFVIVIGALALLWLFGGKILKGVKI